MNAKLKGIIVGALFGLLLMAVTIGMGVGVVFLGSFHYALPVIVLTIIVMIVCAGIGLSEASK